MLVQDSTPRMVPATACSRFYTKGKIVQKSYIKKWKIVFNFYLPGTCFWSLVQLWFLCDEYRLPVWKTKHTIKTQFSNLEYPKRIVTFTVYTELFNWMRSQQWWDCSMNWSLHMHCFIQSKEKKHTLCIYNYIYTWITLLYVCFPTIVFWTSSNSNPGMPSPRFHPKRKKTVQCLMRLGDY